MNKYKVVSDSMTPLIPVGAELFIENIGPESVIKKFDILVFKVDNRLVCHYFWHENRVVASGEIMTKSLKYHEEDLPFKRNDIIGRVTNFKIGFWTKLYLSIAYLTK